MSSMRPDPCTKSMVLSCNQENAKLIQNFVFYILVQPKKTIAPSCKEVRESSHDFPCSLSKFQKQITAVLLWRAGLYLFVVDLAQVSGCLEVFQLKRTQLCLTFVHCNLEAHLQPLLVRGVLAKLSVGNRTMPMRIAPSETSYSNINELRGGSNSHVNFTQFNRPEIRHFKRLNDDDWQENYFDLLRYLVISEPDPKETWIST